jgi:hypothetical protein
VPNQRAVAAEERSGNATATGVPWWGALSIALPATPRDLKWDPVLTYVQP